jgi:hypothetical protein
MLYRSVSIMIMLLTLGVGAQHLPPQTSIKLLFVGQFHSEEISVKSGEVWFGLYKTEAGYELMSTKVNVNPTVDNELMDTEVSTDQEAKPLFLVRGSDRFKPGRILTSFYGREFVFPAQSKDLRFGWDHYFSLNAYGEVTDGQTDTWIKNYQLKLVHGAQSQIVVSIPFFTMEGPPNLIWAGDLDRDGKLDMLLDLGGHYNVEQPTLFLSSMADEGDLVKRVAALRLVGC